MKKSRLLTTLLTLLFTSQSIMAQNGPEPPAYKWVPKDIINVHDSAAILWVRYVKGAEGLAVIDKTGKETGPEVSLPENVLGIAKCNDQALVFYQKDLDTKLTRELRVLTIDLATRKAVPDNIIYSVPGDYYTDFSIQRDRDGNFKGILARVTQYKTKVQRPAAYGEKDLLNMENSTSLSYITLSGAQPVPHLLNLTAATRQGLIIGSDVNSQGDLFIITANESQMTAEKFNTAGVSQGRLSGSLLRKTVIDLDLYFHNPYLIKVDTSSNNAVTVAARYLSQKKDDADIVFRFDFDAHKVGGGKEVILEKPYIKELEAQAPDHKIKSGNTRDMFFLRPVDIQEDKKYTVVCQEVDETVNDTHGSSYYIYIAIISVYDKQMNLLHSVTLDKNATSLSGSLMPCVGIHLKGDKLYAVTTEMNNSLRIVAYNYIVDLTTGNFVKTALPTTPAFKSEFSKPAYTFWMKDGYMFNYATDYFGLGKGRVNTCYMPFIAYD